MRTMVACMAALLWGMVLVASAVAAENNSSNPSTSPQKKYNAAYSICQAVTPIDDHDFPSANKLLPHAAATAHFQARSTNLDSSEPSRITLLDGPSFGGLAPDSKFPASVFVYRPNEGYFGSDQMTFMVEVRGKKLKVVYSVHVTHAPDYGTPECPDSFSIKELPAP